MSNYEKTIEVLQNRVRALEQLMQPVNAVAEPPRWVPKGGDWYVECDGVVRNSQFPSIDIRFFWNGTRYQKTSRARSQRDA